MALEWLKTILGDAYTAEIDKDISAEIGKGFVSRTDFNNLNETKKTLEGQIKERDEQLETLRKSSGDNEALNKRIADLQKDNEEAKTALSDLEAKHATELSVLQFDSSINTKLAAANAISIKAARAELDIDVLKSSKNQEKDTDDAIAALIATLPLLFGKAKPEDAKTPARVPTGGTHQESSTAGGKSLQELMEEANANPEKMDEILAHIEKSNTPTKKEE